MLQERLPIRPSRGMIALPSISAGRMAALYRFQPAGTQTNRLVSLNKFVSQQVRIADQGGQIVVALRASDE